MINETNEPSLVSNQDFDISLPRPIPQINNELTLSKLIGIITDEVEIAQDQLINRSSNRRLSMIVNQISLDLQVNVRNDPNYGLQFMPTTSTDTTPSVLRLNFTPILDSQIQEIANTTTSRSNNSNAVEK